MYCDDAQYLIEVRIGGALTKLLRLLLVPK